MKRIYIFSLVFLFLCCKKNTVQNIYSVDGEDYETIKLTIEKSLVGTDKDYLTGIDCKTVSVPTNLECNEYGRTRSFMTWRTPIFIHIEKGASGGNPQSGPFECLSIYDANTDGDDILFLTRNTYKDDGACYVYALPNKNKVILRIESRSSENNPYLIMDICLLGPTKYRFSAVSEITQKEISFIVWNN